LTTLIFAEFFGNLFNLSCAANLSDKGNFLSFIIFFKDARFFKTFQRVLFFLDFSELRLF